MAEIEMKYDKYAIEFKGKTKNLRILVDNSTDASSNFTDPESGEQVLFLMAIITTKNDEGDSKLGDMCDALVAANVQYHTYDAKSGGPYRITRMGATQSRLKAYGNKNPRRACITPTRQQRQNAMFNAHREAYTPYSCPRVCLMTACLCPCFGCLLLPCACVACTPSVFFFLRTLYTVSHLSRSSHVQPFFSAPDLFFVQPMPPISSLGLTRRLSKRPASPPA